MRTSMAIFGLSLLVMAGCTAAANEDEPTVGDDAEVRAGNTGRITGALSYPSEHLPELRVYAVSTSTGRHFHVKTPASSTTASYELEVPPGQYHLFAYPANDTEARAAYTRAVPCGLSIDCKDHTPIAVSVEKGERIERVDIGDWYSRESIPDEPKEDVPVAGPSGLITGRLGYPSAGVPTLSVYAVRKDGSGFHRLDTNGAMRRVAYSMRVEPGVYEVFAFRAGFRENPTGLVGLYSKAVTCGLQASCNDHSAIEVAVTERGVVKDVDPNDYYHQQHGSVVLPDADRR